MERGKYKVLVALTFISFVEVLAGFLAYYCDDHFIKHDR